MYNFADLPWGISPAEVEAQLAGRGFELDEVADHGAQIFRGRLFNEDAAVVAQFDPRGLAKVGLFLEPDRRRVRDVYENMQQFLIRKYGPPENDYRVFEELYEDGDGDEDLAIRVGKAHFLTMWPKPNGAALYVKIDDELNVVIHYESPGWAAESARREAAEADIL
ncbi:MAG TPA: hypothetical protein VFS20_00695 [Longimicrobium sp.]|nr:hypothetical protein [Longimicrobium sp.]